MIGEKEPLENEEITSGLCDPCFEKEMADVREFQRKRARQGGTSTPNQSKED